MVRTVRFIGLLAVLFAVAFTACKKDKPEKEDKATVVSELSGVYEAKEIRVDAKTKDTTISFFPIDLGHSSTSGENVVQFVFERKYQADFVVVKQEEEKIYLDFQSGAVIKESDNSGQTTYSKGESKFSGYVGVYDRRAKTLQVTLKAQEVMKDEWGREQVTGYILEYSGQKIE